MTGGELPTSGHSYFGIVNSGEQAHAIIEASKLGLLPRVTRRLTDEERLRFVRAGAVFVWEEEEAGIRRWTDHIKWSPSRVSGAFLTYTEIPSKGPETLIKQSFSSVDPSGTKMHLIAYTNKTALSDGSLPSAAHDPLIQGMLARRSNAGRDPRQQPSPVHLTLQSSDPTASLAPNPGKRRQYRGSHPALPPMFPILPTPTAHAHSLAIPLAPSTSSSFPPILLDSRQRPLSTSQDGDSRPRSASSAYDNRPRTSSSEPRPNSAYDSGPRPIFSSSSFALPSPHPSPHFGALSPHSSSSSSTHAFPPAYPAYSQQQLDSRPSSATPSYDSASGFAPLHQPPVLPAPPFELPVPPRLPRSLTSPLDLRRHELPPLQGLPPILPAARHHSPSHAYPDGQDQGTAQPDGAGAQARRVTEDERQLRLLSRML